MRIETVSLIIAAFVSGSLGVAALMRNWRSRLSLSFALLMCVLFIHDLLGMLEGFESYQNWTSLEVHSLVVLLLGPALLWFEKELLGGNQKFLKSAIALYLPSIAVIALFMSFSTYEKVAKSFYFFSHAFYLLPVVIFFLTLDRAQRAATLTRERLRFRYAVWGGVTTLGFFITDALHYSGLESVPPLGTLARVLYLLYIFQTFIQKELMTSEEVLNKIALFGGISMVLSVIYATLVSWVGDQPGLFFFNTFIASFVIIVLFDPIRRLTTRVMRKLFLRRNLMLEEELNHFLQDLVGNFEPRDLAFKIQAILKKSLSVESCSLFLLEKDGLSYSRIPLQASEPQSEISSSNALVEYMQLRRGRPFVMETIETDKDFFQALSARKFCVSCLEAMRTLGCDFIIPIIYDSKPIAFCAVRAGERIALTNEQMRLFIPVSRQLGLVLKNAQTFNFMKDRDKLAAVGEMAAGLAHEIKNPLGAIKGAAELLKEDNQGKNSSEFLQIIMDETDRLSRVVTDFLDYAKPRRSSLQGSCDPVRVIEHTAQLALKGSKVNFELESEEKGLALEADPEVLKQILLNLFLNAVQATEGVERPSLRVRVRRLRNKRFFALDSLPLYKIWEGWRASEILNPVEYIEIEVRDNGVGIDAETQRRLFMPFFTTKAKGTGLGLAICQRLVESMQGTIQVKSSAGAGTSFLIHLPQKRGQAEGFWSKLKLQERFV